LPVTIVIHLLLSRLLRRDLVFCKELARPHSTCEAESIPAAHRSMTILTTSATLSPDGATSTADSRPIVFFDGVCGLCDRSVTFLLDRDTRGSLLFAPLQGETAAQLLSDADRASLKTLVLRLPDGRCHRRSAAAVRILWRLGFGWKVAAVLLWLIPLPLRNLGYRFVAASRYRLFGQRETCRMPTPDDRARLLP
jgi:predicted DCC family thiol-disulfide oxidoreductase YuxK